MFKKGKSYLAWYHPMKTTDHIKRAIVF